MMTQRTGANINAPADRRLSEVLDWIVDSLRSRNGVRGIAVIGASPLSLPTHRSISCLVACDEEERIALMQSLVASERARLLLAVPDASQGSLSLLFDGLLDMRLLLMTPLEIRGKEGPCELGSELDNGFTMLYDPENMLAELQTRVAPARQEDDGNEIPSSVLWYNVAFCANLIMRGDLFRAAMFSRWYLQIWLLNLVIDSTRTDWKRHVERTLTSEQHSALASTFGPLTSRGMREGLLNVMRCYWMLQRTGAPELDPDLLARYRRIDTLVQARLAQHVGASEAHASATSDSILEVLRARNGVRAIAVVGSRSGADPTRIDAYSDLDLLVCCGDDERKDLLAAKWCDRIAEPVLVFPPIMDDELGVLFDELFDCELHFLSPEEAEGLLGACELGNYAAVGFRIVHDPEGIFTRLVQRIQPELAEAPDAETVSVAFWHGVARCANLIAEGDLFLAVHSAHWRLQIRLLELIVDTGQQGWEKYIDRQLTPGQYEMIVSSIQDLTPSGMRLGLFNVMRCYWAFQCKAAPALAAGLLERFRLVEAEVHRRLQL